MEILTQMDGFDQTDNVKVIMATNRIDTIDHALLRPGRLDRKIQFPVPDKIQKQLIFKTVTNKMSLSPDVDIDELASRSDKISGAEINSICQEAGISAIRGHRYTITPEDFEKAYKAVLKKEQKEEHLEFYI